METRSQRILRLLNLPKYETTKGLPSDLRNQALSQIKVQWFAEEKNSSEISNLPSSDNGNRIHLDPATKVQTEKPSSANKVNILSHVRILPDSAPTIDISKGQQNNKLKMTVLDAENSTYEHKNYNVIPQSSTMSDFSEDTPSGSEYLPSDDDEFVSSSSGGQDGHENIGSRISKILQGNKSARKNIFRNSTTPQIEKIELPDSTTSPNTVQSTSCCADNSISVGTHHTSSSNTYPSTSREFHKYSFTGAHRVEIIGAAKDKGKLVRNKGHACYFCQRIVQNAARHFELIHEKESEVAELLAKPKYSKERKHGFIKLIRVGNFYHNTEVLSTNKGNLILVRRPTEEESRFVTPNDYGPCPYCLGFMLKKHLWRHVKNGCTVKNQNEKEDSRHIIAESHALLNDAFGRDFSNDFVINILSKLREDDIGIYCKEDILIQRYGAMMFEKYGTTQCELIRQSMRQLARLTLMLREISNSKRQLTDFLVPEMFDLIVKATKSLCVTHRNIELRPEFELPSLALKIGYALKKCAGIKRGSYLRAGNLSGNEMLVCFLGLMNLEWNTRISSNALATLYSRKINATQLLPLTSDLIKLSSYLNNEMKKQQISLSECPSIKTWCQLASLTLSKIILFNKRRSGEAARMTVAAYSSKPKWSDQSTQELKQSLTEFERKLADQLILVEIIGKRGRKVPVLMTQDVKLSVDELIRTRDTVNIPIKNPFVFARMGESNLYMRGHECLRKACFDAGLECPESITSTKLRKYTATVCQVFNLSENDHDWLARHLGHDIKVHREFYRLHESAVELTKVSRLLLAIDKGEVNKYAGKTLGEINLEDMSNENLDSDEDEKEMEPAKKERLQNRDLNSGEASDYTDTIKKPRVVANVRGSFVQVDSKAAKKPSVRRPWSSEEKAAVLKFFRNLIKQGVVPGKADCSKCIEENECILVQRSWTDVKFCVKNHLDKLKKLR